MMLRTLSRDLSRRVPEWDAPLKWSLAIALCLLASLLLLGFAGPSEIQFPARVGAFGTLVTLQLVFLWGNRREISPYHQAQQHFIAGDYRAAREILEQVPERGRASVDALVLLGNTYRHLGQYELCRRALDEALALKPRHHLALYSRGMLSLVTGDYAAAGASIEQALEAGAPDIVRFELGQCYHLQGEGEAALAQFSAVGDDLRHEPDKRQLLRFYLAQLNQGRQSDRAATEEDIAHWRAEARKHRATPFGRHLDEAVAWMQARD